MSSSSPGIWCVPKRLQELKENLVTRWGMKGCFRTGQLNFYEKGQFGVGQCRQRSSVKSRPTFGLEVVRAQVVKLLQPPCRT